MPETRSLLACWEVKREWDGNRVFVYNYFLSCAVTVTGSSVFRATEIAKLLNRVYEHDPD